MSAEETNLQEIHETVVVNGQEFEVLRGVKQNTDIKFNRVTVMESICHENENGPHQIPLSPFSYSLQSDEQTYSRIMTVGSDWVKMDTGWLGESVSMIHLYNMEGKLGPHRPTDEQKSEIESRVIQVAVAIEGLPKVPCSYLSPKRSIRLQCDGGEGKQNLSSYYWVRCTAGKCRLQVSALPL